MGVLCLLAVGACGKNKTYHSHPAYYQVARCYEEGRPRHLVLRDCKTAATWARTCDEQKRLLLRACALGSEDACACWQQPDQSTVQLDGQSVACKWKWSSLDEDPTEPLACQKNLPRDQVPSGNERWASDECSDASCRCFENKDRGACAEVAAAAEAPEWAVEWLRMACPESDLSCYAPSELARRHDSYDVSLSELVTIHLECEGQGSERCPRDAWERYVRSQLTNLEESESIAEIYQWTSKLCGSSVECDHPALDGLSNQPRGFGMGQPMSFIHSMYVCTSVTPSDPICRKSKWAESYHRWLANRERDKRKRQKAHEEWKRKLAGRTRSYEGEPSPSRPKRWTAEDEVLARVRSRERRAGRGGSSAGSRSRPSAGRRSETGRRPGDDIPCSVEPTHWSRGGVSLGAGEHGQVQGIVIFTAGTSAANIRLELDYDSQLQWSGRLRFVNDTPWRLDARFKVWSHANVSVERDRQRVNEVAFFVEPGQSPDKEAFQGWKEVVAGGRLSPRHPYRIEVTLTELRCRVPVTPRGTHPPIPDQPIHFTPGQM